MDADQFNMFQVADQVQLLSELTQVDTEFVFLHAGCNLGMCMSIYFRVDTEGDRGYFVFGGSSSSRISNSAADSTLKQKISLSSLS